MRTIQYWLCPENKQTKRHFLKILSSLSSCGCTFLTPMCPNQTYFPYFMKDKIFPDVSSSFPSQRESQIHSSLWKLLSFITDLNCVD